MTKKTGFCLLLGAALTFTSGFDQAKEAGVLPSQISHAFQHPGSSQAVDAQSSLPLYFVENRGQTAKAANYVLQTQRGSVYFTPQEIVFQVVNPQRGATTQGVPVPGGLQAKGGAFEETLRVRFLGARQDVQVQALSETAAQFNYFHGSDPKKWVAGARSYEKLRYSGLYAGIDLVVSGQAGKLKNEYVVRPGGDPAAIAISYQGATGLEVNSRGQLEISLSGGKLVEEAPECYQEIDGRRVAVEAAYRIENGNTVRLDVGDYCKDASLIIDPVIYSTFLGGSESDYGVTLAKDSGGNVYVAGYTASTNFPTTGGAFDTTYGGGTYDLFVSKFDPTLSSLLYAAYLGGSGNDGGSGLSLSLSVDDSGCAYLAGYTDSTDFPTTGGAYDTSHNGGTYDAFVTKINAAGSSLAFSTYLGGSAADYGYFVVAADTGSFVGIAGSTNSTDFPTTNGAFDRSHNGSADGFLAIMNASGTGLLYSTFFGGTGSDSIADVGADNAGNLYFSGQTNSTDLPATVGAFDTSHNGSYDAYVAKLDSFFISLMYLTYLGGSSTDSASALKVDETTGEVYVTGRTSSSNFPVTFGAFDMTFNGGINDAFVTKLNAAGSSLLYSTYLGGTGDDGAHGIADKQDKTAVVTGYTNSSDFPTTSDVTDRSYNGAGDVFVTRLGRLGGDIVYSTFVGGMSNEDAYQIVSAGFGNYLVFGLASSTNFPVTPGAYDASQNGKADSFAMMMSIPLEIFANMTAGDFDGDGVDEAAVDFGALGAWMWNAGSWTQLTASDPEGMVAADIDANADDEIVMDMGTVGLWLWNGGVWTQLSGVNVDRAYAGDTDGGGDDEIIGDFSTVGLWLWDSGVWTQLSGVNVDRAYVGDADGNGDDEIVGDFRTVGLWLWDSGAWTQLSGVDSDGACLAETDGTPGKELAVDFGATGLWLWDSGAWSQLSGVNAENIVSGDLDASGDDEIAVDFGATGLWVWNGGAWSQVSGSDATQLFAADLDGSGDDELVADFGFQGLWAWNGGAWSQMSALVAEFLMAADIDGNGDDEILVDFKDQGLWLWNGGAWTLLSASNPD